MTYGSTSVAANLGIRDSNSVSSEATRKVIHAADKKNKKLEVKDQMFERIFFVPFSCRLPYQAYNVLMRK